MASLASLLKRCVPKAPPPLDYPGLPSGEAVYAVGDVHGRLDCLAAAHAMIDRDRARDDPAVRHTEVYLGDYVDRGADSRGVVDRLLARGREVDAVFLRGNHETLFEQFLDGEIPFEEWRRLGGGETLLSYGLDGERLTFGRRVTPGTVAGRVPSEHRAFLSALATYHTVGPYCFVHAGLRPLVALNRQSVKDLTWIRDEFLDHGGDFGHVVVHGHSPVRDVDFRPNRINIDTGAYLTNRLSVLKLDAAGPSLLRPDARPSRTRLPN